MADENAKLIADAPNLLTRLAEHTPGPWELTSDEDGWTIRMGSALADNGHWQVQHRIELEWGDTYQDEGDNSQYEEAEANARLIASAPDLLTALEAVLSEIGSEWDDSWSSRVYEDAVNAIARARGEG